MAGKFPKGKCSTWITEQIALDELFPLNFRMKKRNESGVAQPVGADELLGLITGLVPLGAAGILASVVPVNDPAAVPLMLDLHAVLDTGVDLPTALVRARATIGDDPVTVATALSFVSLGV